MRKLLIIILPVLFFSCSVNKLVIIETLEPAEITIEQPIDTVLFIIKKNKDFLTPDIKVGKKMHDFISKSMPLYYYDGLTDFSKYSGKLFISDSIIFEPSENPLRPLNSSEVIELCKKHNVSGIMVLAYYKITDTIEIIKNTENSIYFPETNTYLYKIVNNTYWRLYSSEGKVSDQKRIDAKYVVTSISGFGDYNENEFQFLSAIESFKTTSYDAAAMYFTRVSPIWQSNTRKIYSYAEGYLPFMKAAKLASKGKWEAAYNLWVPLAEDKNKTVSSRAMYNMAVSFEVIDNINKALYWAEQSYKTLPGSDTENYINLLKERVGEKERVLEQIR
jgi:hypothetical protein